MLVYLGWIVTAFLGGFLLALWKRKKGHSLRENFARVEFFEGRGYREILTIAGEKPDSIIVHEGKKYGIYTEWRGSNMKKMVSLVLLVALLMTSLVSVAEGTTDEFDISADTAKVSELGIPTTSSVAELKKKADELWNAGDYQAAAEAYSIYAKNANWLANLIQAGCEPFYDGTKDERSDFYSATKGGFYTTVSNGESKANGYKSERNRAMTYEALCYYNLGDYVTAVPLLTKALDLIEIDQVEYWELCTNALYDIVGLK